jgi:hypothetical protein
MEMLATFGAMVITEGANAANVVSAHATPHQREAADAVFAGYTAQAAPPLPVTLMVITASAMTIKGVALEAMTPDEEEETRTPQEILAEQQPPTIT